MHGLRRSSISDFVTGRHKAAAVHVIAKTIPFVHQKSRAEIVSMVAVNEHEQFYRYCHGSSVAMVSFKHFRSGFQTF